MYLATADCHVHVIKISEQKQSTINGVIFVTKITDLILLCVFFCAN